MMIEHIANKAIEYATILYYMRWERWGLPTLGLLALFLLVRNVRIRRKIATSEKLIQ
jgi:hypothetical protein